MKTIAKTATILGAIVVTAGVLNNFVMSRQVRDFVADKVKELGYDYTVEDVSVLLLNALSSNDQIAVVLRRGDRLTSILVDTRGYCVNGCLVQMHPSSLFQLALMPK
jgi:hypothetical protein